MTVKIAVKSVRHPFVRAAPNQLVVARPANESSDPVCALDVRRKLRVNVCRGFEDAPHLLVFLDAAVDVGVAACHLVKALLLVDHVLEKEYVLVLVFGCIALAWTCLKIYDIPLRRWLQKQ